MLVKELLEKTLEVKISEIAKEVGIGEKKLRAALKNIGCEPNGVGKKGWSFKGENEMILEQPIFDFVDAIESENTNKNASRKNSNNGNNGNINNKTKRGDKMAMEIKDLIKGKNKDDNARVYKGIYFDKDIAAFLDDVQHGNKSEIVNKILRQYLVDNELM